MIATTSMRSIRRRLPLLIAATMFAASACTALPGASPTMSPSEEVPPTPTTAPSTAPSETATAVETMAPGDFWSYVGGVDQVETYDSLDAIIGAADLIVITEIVDVREGRQIEFPESGETMYMAELRARVTDVLQGTPVTPSDEGDTIIVEKSYGFSPAPDRLSLLEASAPSSRVVLFLVNKAADAVRHGFEPDAAYAGEEFYLLLRGDQAAIRDEQGTAKIGPGESTPEWVDDLDGRSFDEVVSMIEDAIAAH